MARRSPAKFRLFAPILHPAEKIDLGTVVQNTIFLLRSRQRERMIFISAVVEHQRQVCYPGGYSDRRLSTGKTSPEFGFRHIMSARLHYGVGVVPARPYKPRDKPKVKSGVLLVERWIVAALRNRRFFSTD